MCQLPDKSWLAPCRPHASLAAPCLGSDLVFTCAVLSKHRARIEFLVVSVDLSICHEIGEANHDAALASRSRRIQSDQCVCCCARLCAAVQRLRTLDSTRQKLPQWGLCGRVVLCHVPKLERRARRTTALRIVVTLQQGSSACASRHRLTSSSGVLYMNVSGRTTTSIMVDCRPLMDRFNDGRWR